MSPSLNRSASLGLAAILLAAMLGNATAAGAINTLHGRENGLARL